MHGRKRIIPALITLLLVFAVLFSGTFIGASDTDVKLNNISLSDTDVSFKSTASSGILKGTGTFEMDKVSETVSKINEESTEKTYDDMLGSVLSSYCDAVDYTYSSTLVSRKEWLEMFFDVFGLRESIDHKKDGSYPGCSNLFEIAKQKNMYLSDSFADDPYAPVLRKEAGDTIFLYLGYTEKEYGSSDYELLSIQTYLQTALYYGYFTLDENGNADPYGYVTKDDLVKIRKDLEIYRELKDKVIFGFGDSIMAGNGNYHRGIIDLLSDKYKMRGYDFSVGGTAFGYKENCTCIHEQIIKASKLGMKPDYILIDGGTNDLRLKDMGSISDDFSYINNGFSSFASGMEYCFGLIKENYYNVPVMYISCHRMAIYKEEQESYHSLALDICDKWGVPCIDLYSNSGFDPDDSELVSKYTLHKKEKFPDGDSIHPNQEMYMIYYIPYISEAVADLSSDRM